MKCPRLAIAKKTTNIWIFFGKTFLLSRYNSQKNANLTFTQMHEFVNCTLCDCDQMRGREKKREEIEGKKTEMINDKWNRSLG